jgi:hypothetical protein
MYSRKEKIQDALAVMVAAPLFFIVVWIAFALDVITTGM